MGLSVFDEGRPVYLLGVTPENMPQGPTTIARSEAGLMRVDSLLLLSMCDTDVLAGFLIVDGSFVLSFPPLNVPAMAGNDPAVPMVDALALYRAQGLPDIYLTASSVFSLVATGTATGYENITAQGMGGTL